VRRTSRRAWSISASGVENVGSCGVGPSDDRERRAVGVGIPVDVEGAFPGVDRVGKRDMANNLLGQVDLKIRSYAGRSSRSPLADIKTVLRG
jgi:hypothetical protein